MQVFNTTPYSIGYLLGRVRYPAPSLSVVVKGTFALRPGAPAAVAAQQLPLAADSPEEDDGPTSLRYPADLVHYKPRTDVLCVGDCHVGAAPVARTTVALRVGGWSKTLNVTGDRTWDVLGASAPAPFRSMPIGYERAFGGPDFSANPVGRGLSESLSAGVRAIWLPNVERPEDSVTRPGSRASPGGFGPLRRSWAPRVGKVGTYGGDWLERRWPWQPDDYDPSYQNAAPEDMQLPFLRGDEALGLLRLHPEHPDLSTQLPGVRVRCFLASHESSPSLPLLRELRMELDTVWIDASALALVLVWRGVADVASDEADEVKYLFVSEEPISARPSPMAVVEQSFQALLAARDADEPPLELFPDEPAADEAFDEAMAAAEQRAHAQMREAGLDPEQLPQSTAEQEAEQAAHLAALGFSPLDDVEPEWTRERVQQHAMRSGSFSGQTLRGLDLSGLDLSGVGFDGADLQGANLADARLQAAVFVGANLASASFERARLERAILVDCDLTGANLSGALAADATFDGALLEEARFAGGHFERISARRISAARADWSEARLAHAVLCQSNLSGATLEGADLRDADLTDATLEAVRAARLDARGANLSELRAAEGSDFSDARLDDVQARGSNWERADLRRASLVRARLDDANLSGSALQGADLAGASLRASNLRRADASQARLEGADLFEAILEAVDARGADFSGASLFGAETLDARFEGARFSGADFKRTKLVR